jgi:hypothetical protein
MARLLRRSVLRLMLVYLGPAGCGAQSNPPSQPTDSGTPLDAVAGSAEGAVCDDAVDAGPPCSTIACIPPVEQPQGYGCPKWTYAIYGTGAECGADDAGDLPLAACVKLCPPVPADAGYPANPQPVACALAPGRNLVCTYSPCPL